MSGCRKKSTKKYTSRSSPPYPANECCGMKKRGNNGEMYVSIRASTGVCRWVKSVRGNKSVRGSRVKKSVGGNRVRKYDIHDNGARPFRVFVGPGNHIQIAKRSYETDKVDEPFVELDVERVMLGKESPLPNRERSEKGNNILLEVTPNRFMYIGTEIREFSPVKGDRINKFYSDIGGSDVPYAYGIGDDYIYLFSTFDNGKVKAVDKSFFRPLNENDSFYNQVHECHNLEICLRSRGRNNRDRCKDKQTARARIAELKEKTTLLPSKLVHRRL